MRIEPCGAVNASVGLMGTGQGYESPLAQAVAEGLGVRAEDVGMHLGNTDVAPYGMGSRGGRGGTAGGGALYLCAQKAQERVLTIAASMLGLNHPGGLRLRAGEVERMIGDDWQNAGLTLADVARRAYLDPLALPEGIAPGLDFSLTYDPPAMTYSNATHACEVELDLATGALSIGRYLVVEDCGTVLNPIVVRGQQQGAVAMGLSGALLEEVVYDADRAEPFGHACRLSRRLALRNARDGNPACTTPRTGTRPSGSRAWPRAASWGRSARSPMR